MSINEIFDDVERRAELWINEMKESVLNWWLWDQECDNGNGWPY